MFALKRTDEYGKLSLQGLMAMGVIHDLKERELFYDCTNVEDLSKTLDSQPTVFYCGFDPTADSLHVGSLLPLLVMRRLQAHGHHPLVVLGTATAMIGDPSGKSAERNLLTREVVEHNSAMLESQISQFLLSDGDSRFEMLSNRSWLEKLSMLDFLRDIGKHFSVNAMIAKDSVRTRIDSREQGISFTEFSYMILQAYDFYWLHKTHNCQLQIGGADQWGNITAGIDLIRRVSTDNKKSAYGLTLPLLTTSSGQKIGKTEEGTIWLDSKRTSPYRFFQYWINRSDDDALRFLRLLTDIQMEEILSIEHEHRNSPHERKAQTMLASKITEMVHGPTEAQLALKASEVLFGGSFEDLSPELIEQIFSEVPSSVISQSSISCGLPLVDLLTNCGAAPSRSQARRLIEGGGVYVNAQRETSPVATVDANTLLGGRLIVIRTGKKKFYLVRSE